MPIFKKGEIIIADGKIIIDTDLDTKGLRLGLSKIGSIASAGLKGTAVAIGTASAALGGLGAIAVSSGKDFEVALAKTSTLFGDVNVDTQGLNKNLLDMSKSTGIASSQIGNSLYNALSAGIPVTEDMGTALGYMDKNAKLAKAGFTDIDTTVTATAKVLNAYKMDVSETDKVHKILMQTQNKGITTVGELGSCLAQVTPTAAAMNVSFEQVGAALASMTAQGTPTAQATTQLNTLFAELGKQGTVAQKSLENAAQGSEYAGMSFQEMMKAGVPLNEVLDLMGVSANTSDQSLIDMFGSIEAGKAALALCGQNAEQYTANLAAMSTQTDVVGDAYAKVMDTLEEKTKVGIESAKNLGIAVFTSVQEPLKDMADKGCEYITQLSDAFAHGGLQGLVEEVGTVFSEIVTSAVEQAPKMADAAADIVKSFASGIIANKDKIMAAAGDLVRTIADTLVSLLPKEIQIPLRNMVDDIAKSFESGGIKKGIDTFSTLIKNAGKAIEKISKTVLPIFTGALDKVAGGLEVIIPLLAAGVTAFKAWKIVSAVAKTLDVLKESYGKATVKLTAFITANGVEAISVAASTGAITLKQIAVGVLSKQIGLATAAQALWNIAMSANPIGIVIVAVAALTAGIAAYCATQEKEITAAEKAAATTEKLGDNLTKAGESASSFYSGVSSAGSVLDDFNTSIAVSSEQQSALAQQMTDVQLEITNIARAASTERRNLTGEEIARMDELFAKMRDLATQELEQQTILQQVVQDRAVDAAANHNMELEEYTAYSQKLINSAEETKNSVITKAEEQMNNTLALARQRYTENGVLDETAYGDARIAAQAEYTAAVDEANLKCGDTLSIIQKGYKDRSDVYQGFAAKQAETQAAEKAENARYVEEINGIDEDFATAKSNVHDKITGDFSDFATKETDAQAVHKANLETINGEWLANMSDSEAKQLGIWLAMVSDTELHGGEISDETQTMVDTILANMDSLPEGTRGTMSDAMEPIYNEMKAAEPDLFAKADGIWSGIMSRLNRAFVIDAPVTVSGHPEYSTSYNSRSAQPNSYSRFASPAKANADRFRGLDVSGMVSNMVASVKSQVARVSATFGASANYNVARQNQSLAATISPTPINVKSEPKIFIGEREIAHTIAPFVSEEIAWLMK